MYSAKEINQILPKELCSDVGVGVCVGTSGADIHVLMLSCVDCPSLANNSGYHFCCQELQDREQMIKSIIHDRQGNVYLEGVPLSVTYATNQNVHVLSKQ